MYFFVLKPRDTLGMLTFIGSYDIISLVWSTSFILFYLDIYINGIFGKLLQHLCGNISVYWEEEGHKC